jgi:hypothetical protein
MRFFSTMGIELTWLYHKKDPMEQERMFAYAALVRIALKENGVPCHHIHLDDLALEIGTPALGTMDAARRYYHLLLESLAVYPLVTHREDCTSGGGHIHVAIPKNILKSPSFLLLFLTNLFRDTTNRPYLNWIFNEWATKESSKSLVWLKKQMYRHSLFENETDRKMLEVIFGNPKIKGLKTYDILKLFACNKGYSVRVEPAETGKPATIEFRYFDAKKSFLEIELHLKFVDAYMKYISELTVNGTIVSSKVKTAAHLAAFARKDRAVSEFQTLLRKLGLNYADYRDFVETNYRARKAARLLN